MNKKIVLILTLAFLLFSATSSLANAQVTREKHSVPFKLTAAETGTAIPISQETPWILAVTTSGSGESTHMGRTIISQQMTVDTIALTFYDGVFVCTAANGDTINGGYSGYLVPTSAGLEIHGVLTIDGGTGRFEGATGGGIASGMQFPDLTAELIIDGAITSVGFKE